MTEPTPPYRLKFTGLTDRPRAPPLKPAKLKLVTRYCKRLPGTTFAEYAPFVAILHLPGGQFTGLSPGKASDMLVLSRKAGETIRIGSSIDLVVLGVSHGRVKLGFAGPKQIPVRRGELVDAEARQGTPPTALKEEYECRELAASHP